MDSLTRRIADFAASASFDRLSEADVHIATQRLVDSLACAVAAYDCETAEIGLRLARGAVPARYPGRILGHGERSTAEDAAFVNTCLIRALDYNDHFPGGHPSDCLGAMLALAEPAGADGRRLLASMDVAYELFIRFSEATGLRERGWDQGFAVGIGTAAAVGNLLGLDAKAIGEAVAITAVANVPMRNTRAGELSLWKGAATAFAVRNGVFAALLAAEGMTGPDRPFEGRHGLWDLITGPFELPALPTEGGPYRISEIDLKYWPVEYNAQLVVWAGRDLRERVDWRDLASVDVGTYAFAVSEIGMDPEKWDPKTRETADHSLPYILARALVDGTIDAGSFEESAYRDPALRPLMAKISVRTDEAIDRAYPNTVGIVVDAVTTAGERHHFELENPLGHEKNPMQDKDVSAKFLGVAERVLGADRANAALQQWWNIAQTPDLSKALDLLDRP
jgi:2-methylcitrate dehydratase